MPLPPERKSGIIINRGSNRGTKNGYKSSGTAHLSFLRGNMFVAIGLISFVGMIIFLFLTNIILFVFFGFLFIASMYVLAAGKVEVKEKEVAIVQRWGAYLETLRPGLNFTIPHVDAVVYKEEKEKTMFSTQRAIKLPLFLDKDGKPLKIEFKLSTEDGVDFGVYYKIFDPERAIYYADDLERYIADKVENCAKGAFGSTLVEVAIVNKLDVVKNTHTLLEASTGLKGSANDLLREAGVEIESVYFNDIDLSEVTKKKRKEIFDQQQAALIKEQEAKAVAKEADVEAARVKVEAQKVLQEGQKGKATRNRIDGMRGEEKDLSSKEVVAYEIQMEKYKKGVQITEINVGGGSGASELGKMAAIGAATYNSLNKDKKTQNEPKTRSEEESKDGQDEEEQESEEQQDEEVEGGEKKKKNKEKGQSRNRRNSRSKKKGQGSETKKEESED